MDLEVILLGTSLPLERCLRQIGTPYRVAEPNGMLPPVSAVYIATADSSFCRRRIGELLQKNRAVLVPESMKNHFTATPLFFTYPDIHRLPGIGSIAKTFSVGGLHPNEDVAVHPTNPSVRFFLRLLTHIFEKQGLLFPALSFYPEGYKTLFSFRVDADEYDADICASFFNKAARYSEGTTIFFSAANFLHAIPVIRGCEASGFAVFSHAFYHYTYQSFRQNLYNIRKATDFFDPLGVRRQGFAAPHGRWNPGFQRALAESGYDFSSDFSYDYDGYPSFPQQGSGFSNVLQIPIHPVCSGICLETARGPLTHLDLDGYFEAIFDQKYHSEEPIIFYEHPTAWTVKEFTLIDRWFDMARNAPDVWICQLSEFAGWWRERGQLKPKVTQEPYGSRVRLECEGLPSSKRSCALNLYRKGSGEYAQVRLSGDTTIQESATLRFQERAIWGKKECGGIPARETQPFKNYIKRSLDWETVTPCGELITDDLQTAAKKTLRLLTGASPHTNLKRE